MNKLFESTPSTGSSVAGAKSVRRLPLGESRCAPLGRSTFGCRSRGPVTGDPGIASWRRRKGSRDGTSSSMPKPRILSRPGYLAHDRAVRLLSRSMPTQASGLPVNRESMGADRGHAASRQISDGSDPSRGRRSCSRATHGRCSERSRRLPVEPGCPTLRGSRRERLVPAVCCSCRARTPSIGVRFLHVLRADKVVP